MKNFTLLALLPAGFLLLTACDDAAAPLPDPGSELRKSLIRVSQQPTSKSFTVDIMPDPINGGPDGPHFDPIIRNADAIMGAAFQGSIESQEFCPEACVGKDADWTGRVAAEGEYEIGEITEYETDAGELGYMADVQGEVAMVCLCI